MRILKFIPFVFFLSACGLLPTLKPLTTSTPVFSGGQIAFYSTSNGVVSTIYTINADGSNLFRLVDGKLPVWSPDGEKIVFIKNGDLYIMDLSTRKNKQLTNKSHISEYSHPVWFPNGQKIAFGTQDGNIKNIRIILSDGSNIEPNYADGSNPVWSFDGQQFAYNYQDRDDAPVRIFVENKTHTNGFIISHDESSPSNKCPIDPCPYDKDPVFSPDGQKIIFVSNRNGEGIYSISTNKSTANNNTPIRLTDEGAAPSWSPDGQHIAFISRRDDVFEIYMMNSTGNNQTRITFLGGIYALTPPAWSPDGKQLAFISNVTGNNEIYTINTDGSNLLRLTNNDVDDWGPVWQPQPGP